MSSIHTVGANAAAYQPTIRATASQSKRPTPTAPQVASSSDPDHDGDPRAGGIDVKG